MTDKEFLLHLLEDRQPHAGSEINRRSYAIRGKRITIHSRISDLRKDGWIIIGVPDIREGERDHIYQLHGWQDKEQRVRGNQKKPDPVQAFIYMTQASDTHNGRVCHIVERAEPDGDLAMFVVEFTRGSQTERMTVCYDELHPWYAIH